MTSSAHPSHRAAFMRSLAVVSCLLVLALPAFAADAARKAFDIPAGDAEKSLNLFARQSGEQILYPPTKVGGVQTNPVRGEMTSREALERMVEGTVLEVLVDAGTGALTVRRSSSVVPNKSVPKQTEAGADPGDSKEVVTMSPFEVVTNKDYGYRKTMSTTTSRVAIPIVENPQAVEIISGELIKDFGVTMPQQVFRYSASVLVGENEVSQAHTYSLRGFNLPIFYNGLGLASSFSVTPFVPVDNIDRIEVAKGPVGLYFGNSTPNGVANYVTKRPEFRQATSLELTAGSFNFYKALVDTQAVISKEAGLAYRLIASYQDNEARVDNMHSTLTFVAPSVVYRPNDKLEVTAEFNYARQHLPYPSLATWNFALNPQYYKDVLSPSQDLINYMKSTYGLADDTAAKALMQTRWGFPPLGTNLNGMSAGSSSFSALYSFWAKDRYGLTGVEPSAFAGSTIDWWRFSPRGDKYNAAMPGSNLNGDYTMADMGVTLTPVQNLSVKYHWLHGVNNAGFFRQLANPAAGLRPDGRAIAVNTVSAVSLSPSRYSLSDAQQLDASYTFSAVGMKHNIMAGMEWDRAKGTVDNITVNLDQASSIVDSYTLPGNVLTGRQAAYYWDPFGTAPVQPLYALAGSGGAKLTNFSVTNQKAYYASYRASALDNKLNVLVGIRRTELLNTGRKEDTPTIGGIYEVTSGFHVFASASQAVSFTNQLSWVGAGVTPADNAHLLDNVKEKGYEIGVKTDWRDNTLSGTMSYYGADRDGVIVLDYVRMYSDPRNTGANFGNPNTQASPYVNGGLYRAEGIDGDIVWTPNQNFQLMANFDWEFTSKIVKDPSLNPATPGILANQGQKRRLGKAPEYKANLVGKYTFTSGTFHNFSVGCAIRYTDTYFVSDSPIFLTMSVPEEYIFDAFAIYNSKIGKMPTEYKLTLINLTNKINDMTRGNGFEARFGIAFKL